MQKLLDEHAEELRPRHATGEVRFACSEGSAEVLLDGVPVGTCEDFAGPGQGLKLEGAQEHVVEVKKPGFAPYRATVAGGGALTTLKVELRPSGS